MTAISRALPIIIINHSTSAQWIRDAQCQIANEAHSVELTMVVIYPTSASGITNGFFLTKLGIVPAIQVQNST